jgi:hypothetical protein
VIPVAIDTHAIDTMIAVFAANRPEFLAPCLQSLKGEKGVHIFVDAVNEEVERICRTRKPTSRTF